MGSLAVAAIDFGTTYSGWAFSFTHDYERDPIKVSLKRWQGGTLVSHKSGTIDVTVHEVTEGGELKELHKASGGAWGGTKVDQAYEAFLTSIVGSDVFLKFKNKHLDDYIEVFRDFEIKKRQICPTKQETITIRMPDTISTLCREMRKKDFKGLVLQSRFSDKVIFVNGKLRIDADVIREFFRSTVQNIIDHVASLLTEPSVVGCAAILMVGGFSDSPMLQENVQEQFPNHRIIVPDDADLAVLKGAVIFGHKPAVITERVCKYTYGTATSHKYKDSCKHPKGIVEKDENCDLRCYDLFRIHAKAGQSVKLNEEQKEQIYTPVSDDQTSLCFNIYSSPATHPYLTTEEGCSLIGKISIPISDTSLGRNHEFGTSFSFGGTEIVVKVVDKANGDVTFESVNCLG